MDKCGKEGKRQRARETKEDPDRERRGEDGRRGRLEGEGLELQTLEQERGWVCLQPSGDSRNKLGFEMRDRRSVRSPALHHLVHQA